MRKMFCFLVVLLMALVGYSQKAEKYYKKGDEKFQDQNFQAASDYYSKAIKIDPKFAEAYLKRGKSKGELHDYLAQFIDCSKAIEINPSYAEAYVYRGIAKMYLYDNGAAVSMIDSGKVESVDVSALKFDTLENGTIKVRGSVTTTISGIGMVKNDYTMVIADFDKAIELMPNYAEAYYNRGIAKIKSDQNKGGCSDFRKAKDLGYSNPIEQLNINCQ